MEVVTHLPLAAAVAHNALAALLLGRTGDPLSRAAGAAYTMTPAIFSATPVRSMKPELSTLPAAHQPHPGPCTPASISRWTNPRVVTLIVFTSVVGMFLSTPSALPLAAFVWGTLGIALAAPRPRQSTTCGPELGRDGAYARAPTADRHVNVAAGAGVSADAWIDVDAYFGFRRQHAHRGADVISLIGYSIVYTVYFKTQRAEHRHRRRRRCRAAVLAGSRSVAR